MVKRNFKFVFIFAIIACGGFFYYFTKLSPFTSPPKIKETTLLKVMTYSSFASDWGPGPIIKSEFEKNCNCIIEWNILPDSRSILSKYSLLSENQKPDIIIGLDLFDALYSENSISVKDLNFSDLFKVNGEPAFLKILNESKSNNSFQNWIPYDWGILTFVTKKNFTDFDNVKNLKDFTNSKFSKKIVLQDPRTSSPGLIFLIWVFNQMTEEEAIQFYKKLNVFTYGSSWSDAYGLFTQGQVQSVFSYTTSPHYHLLEEKDPNFRAINFEQNLPVQIEHMGLVSDCKNCELGKEFIQFMLTPEIQKIIMQKNYMYPVIKNVTSNTPFEDANKFNAKIPNRMNHKEIEYWISKWKEIIRE